MLEMGVLLSDFAGGASAAGGESAHKQHHSSQQDTNRVGRRSDLTAAGNESGNESA